jgi:hypothetical protein
MLLHAGPASIIEELDKVEAVDHDSFLEVL